MQTAASVSPSGWRPSSGPGELAAPAYRRLPGRSELANWAFEGAGYQYITLTVDAILLIVALVVADQVNPADSYLPALVISPLAVLFLATRRQYDPHAQIGRLDRAAAVVGSTAAAAIVVAALVQLTHPSATAAGLIAIQFALRDDPAARLADDAGRRSRRARAQAAPLRAADADHRRRRGRRRARAPPRGAAPARPDRRSASSTTTRSSPDEVGRRDAPVLGSTAGVRRDRRRDRRRARDLRLPGRAGQHPAPARPAAARTAG